jgi:predicted amino acid dehydrogenase
MKVAILGHLLTRKEYRYLFPYARWLPLPLIEWFISIVPDNKKFMPVSRFSIFDKAEGYVVGIAITSHNVMNWPKEKVRKIISDACLYAQNELKCDLVMLGALTAPATAAGLWLREQPELKIKITTGNTYTAAIAIEGADKAMELAQLEKDKIKMAIVGAAGVIGEAVAKHYSQEGFNLILIEREVSRFKDLESCLVKGKYVLSDKVSDIINADIIITATSHPEALIVPEYLKKNAIIIDVAEPSDVVEDIEERRPDVISIDAGRVKWEHVDIKYNLGLPKHVGFACITEGMMQALENDYHDYIGSVDMEHLKRTMAWGRKWDFPLADFTCFNKLIPLNKFKIK